MNERVIRQIIWIGAVTVLIVGAMSVIRTIRQVDTVSLTFETKLRDLEKLKTMDRENARYDAARRSFERLTDRRPVSLPGLLKDTLPGHKAGDIREIRREFIPGWIVRHKEIAFSEVPLDGLMRFVHKAENSKPPWRLVKCVVRASTRSRGAGNVVLVMEALEGQGNN